MATLIGIISQKGGVGKSSIAQGLAALHDDTSPPTAVLVDADPQRSTTEWFERRPQRTPELYTIDGSRDFAAVIRAQEGRPRVIVVDTPPTISDFVRSVARRADFVLIPCGMGSFDVEAAIDTVEMVREAGTRHQVILTRVPAARGGAVAPLVKRARGELRSRGAGVWSGHIVNRLDWAYAAERGLAVHEHAPHSPAAAELLKLWRALNGAAGIRPSLTVPREMLQHSTLAPSVDEAKE